MSDESSRPRRPYRQRARREQTEQRRQSIIEAARALLVEQGATALTLETVARRCGTTRQTVHNLIGSRADLLLVLTRDSQQRSGFDRLLAALALPDPVDATRGALREGVRIYAREAPVIRGIYAAGALHDELRPAFTRIEELRLHAQQASAVRLAAEGALAVGWDEHAAAEALFVITSFGAFDLLHSGLGLNEDATSTILLRMLDAMLDRKAGS